MKNNTSKGIILITSLWIIAILTVFAVSLARQALISIRLASYDIDRQKAYFIAHAGILRAISEKMLEYKTGMSTEIDALSQSWANNKELFFRREFGEGTYTLWYEHHVLNNDGATSLVMHGLMDEQSKINLNIADESILRNILLYVDVEQDYAVEMAGSILDWRDPDSAVASTPERLLYGAENDYYQGLSPAYSCKNIDFDHIYELVLVKGFTSEIIDKIKPYLTVYGDGRVNINTASFPVLHALFGPGFPGLAGKIADYRAGADGIPGTKDDRWFSIGPVVVDRASDGMVEIKNLQDAQWYANIYGITTDEYNRIRELAIGINPQLCVHSAVYRAKVLSEVKKVQVELQAVYDFTSDKELPKIKFWYQE
jgi:type II secretory pathway component PulK